MTELDVLHEGMTDNLGFPTGRWVRLLCLQVSKPLGTASCPEAFTLGLI